MDRWEYNAINQQDYLGSEWSEDDIDRVLNSFGKDGWELVGWFGVWFIFKRKLNT